MEEVESQQLAGPAFLPHSDLQTLLDNLQSAGFTIIGPRIDQGAIVYDQVQRVDELPRGWTDQQEPGLYRLHKRDDQAYFGYAVGPHSWKRFLFPPTVDLMKSQKTTDGWKMSKIESEVPRYAFLGVRACELSAIAIQDKVFLNSGFIDSTYQSRRERCLIVAVQCTTAASTCFCTSMDTGPNCHSGFDLALTEIGTGFVIEVGSEQGRQIAEKLPLQEITREMESAAESARQRAVDEISRSFDAKRVQSLLSERLQHARWDEVAEKCLSCANCTLVCPTCFCSSVDDVTKLTDDEVIRQRRWDSCFNFDFSHISGGSVRDSTRSRYRQWLTHKLSTWVEQFGTSGCVGCGRCITWCPVGIDLMEEATIICSSDANQQQEGTN